MLSSGGSSDELDAPSKSEALAELVGTPPTRAQTRSRTPLPGTHASCTAVPQPRRLGGAAALLPARQPARLACEQKHVLFVLQGSLCHCVCARVLVSA